MRVEISPDVMARHLGEETVILDVKSGTYFGLDGVGTRVWQLLEDKRSIEEICAALVEGFDVGIEQAQADVDELLAELSKRSLVALIP